MLSKGLIAASSKSLILGILKSGRTYGYAIIKGVRELSGGELEWSEGMLYPVLHRLEKEGLIISEWVVVDNAKPRKYYSITEAGKEVIKEERENWLSVHKTLLRLWNQPINDAHEGI